MPVASRNYRKLDLAELPEVVGRCGQGWKSPEIPRRQWESVVRGELERYRAGEPMPHFDVLVRALMAIRVFPATTLLDVGASSAFYSEVLRIGNVSVKYAALDFSEAYRELAAELFPDVPFKVGDATDLPYEDNAFDVLLHGCCLLHIRNYERAIAEAARVAKDFVIFHRTPIFGETTYWEKEAYGVGTVEIWFGEEELHALFERNGLEIIRAEDIFTGAGDGDFGHRTYTTRVK